MARLVVIQQPQETFHKDEGGKSNNLSFRVVLQGDIDPSVGGAKGEVPLDVVAVYEDGTPVPKQDQIISITGCTEKPSGGPCVCLVSRLGGVLYRLKRVSKRLDDRAVCVRVSLRGCPEVPPVQSNGTMVFSKRKNKEQREEEQAREREEMEKREAEVATLLVRGQVSGRTDGSDRPAKHMRVDTATGYDTDEASSELNSGLIEELLRRVSDLEHSVAEQQKLIDEMRNGSTMPPPLTMRSTSQALWNIPTNIGPIGTFLFPPMLKRDTSCESFPELPALTGQ
jgi:hypothetical protein